MGPTPQSGSTVKDELSAHSRARGINQAGNAGSQADEPRRWVKPYYAAFDGLRALAVLATFLAHYISVAKLGAAVPFLWTGVDLFFVLSGFLITGILYDSLARPDYFRNFYIRRALRILPLSYGFFLLVIVLTPVLHLQYSHYLWTTPLYVANFFMRGAMLQQHGSPFIIFIPKIAGRPVSLGPLWSLCVEEQFYLVWPLLIWWLPRRRTLMRLSLVLILVALVIRFILQRAAPALALQTNFLYYSTYTRFDTLLVGSWLALWLRSVEATRAKLRQLSSGFFLGSVGLLSVAWLLFGKRAALYTNAPVVQVIGFPLVAVAAAALILRCIDERSRLHRALLWAPLQRLGLISYGFYFLHSVPETMFASFTRRHLYPHHLQWLVLPMAFAWSYGSASISFRYLERPFLALKKRLAPSEKDFAVGRGLFAFERSIAVAPVR